MFTTHNAITGRTYCKFDSLYAATEFVKGLSRSTAEPLEVRSDSGPVIAIATRGIAAPVAAPEPATEGDMATAAADAPEPPAPYMAGLAKMQATHRAKAASRQSRDRAKK